MSNESDALGNRMKFYEGFEAQRRLLPRIPVIARLDGINFSKFTADLKRPYEEKMSHLMWEVAEFLLKYFGADAAYTQSDEITLGWNPSDPRSDFMLGGRVQKLDSHMSAKASVRFNKLLPKYLPEKADEEPALDCRTFNVPNLEEAANQFLWRELDASKNSISMAASSWFSHNQLMNKSGAEKQEMLFKEHGVNWNDYPNFFKRGLFIVKRKRIEAFKSEEIEKLPLRHEARTDPDLKIERTVYQRCFDMPKFSTVVNRAGFLFLGEDPVVE